MNYLKIIRGNYANNIIFVEIVEKIDFKDIEKNRKLIHIN
jgi:hypothetical protein